VDHPFVHFSVGAGRHFQNFGNAVVMRRIILIAGVAVLVASLVYLVIVVRNGLSELPEIAWTATSLASVGAGIAIYVAAVAVWSGGWAVLLTAVGQPARVVNSFTIIGISQITKYLPGNVVHHIGRAALATKFGLGSANVVLSMVLEFFWMVAAAVACALVAFALTDAADVQSLLPFGRFSFAVLFAAAVAIPLGGFVAARKLGGRLLRQQSDDTSARLPDFGRSGINFLSHWATFLLQGAILVLIAQSIFDITFSDYWLAVGAFALAFVAGFVAPGVPAGLGVREAVLVAGLSLEMSAGSALAVATAHRLINVVGDGVIFGIAMGIRRFVRSPSADES
jgi:uncharacterized membrane protein YbhN (UPF0104 family)